MPDDIDSFEAYIRHKCARGIGHGATLPDAAHVAGHRLIRVVWLHPGTPLNWPRHPLFDGTWRWSSALNGWRPVASCTRSLSWQPCGDGPFLPTCSCDSQGLAQQALWEGISQCGQFVEYPWKPAIRGRPNRSESAPYRLVGRPGCRNHSEPARSSAAGEPMCSSRAMEDRQSRSRSKLPSHVGETCPPIRVNAQTCGCGTGWDLSVGLCVRSPTGRVSPGSGHPG